MAELFLQAYRQCMKSWNREESLQGQTWLETYVYMENYNIQYLHEFSDISSGSHIFSSFTCTVAAIEVQNLNARKQWVLL